MLFASVGPGDSGDIKTAARTEADALDKSHSVSS